METIVLEQQNGWQLLKISDKYIAVTLQEMGRLNRLSDNGKKLFELPSTELFEACAMQLEVKSTKLAY